jgi:hypothetical protein
MACSARGGSEDSARKSAMEPMAHTTSKPQIGHTTFVTGP